MAYTIRNSDGTVLLTLPDGQIDQQATSVTLIGRNVSSYGQYYNDNLVSMLQNFASDGIQPRSPTIGQLWYNRSNDRVYVFSNDQTFKPISGAQVLPSEPVAPNIGDLWIDNVNKQLYFTSDGIDFTLVGPQGLNETNKNGWYPATINSNTLAVLYNNDKVVAIASSSTVTFGSSFDGMTSVQPGINLNQSISNIRFVGIATSATYAFAVSTDTNAYILAEPASPTPPQRINGGLTITGALIVDQAAEIGGILTSKAGMFIDTELGLTIARNTLNPLDETTVQFGVDVEKSYIASQQNNRRFEILTGDPFGGPSVLMVAMRVNPNDFKPSVDFFPGVPSSRVNVTNDFNVNGDFVVTGTFTKLDSTDINIKSSSITLGYEFTDDLAAESGGIVLKGSSDHILDWTGAFSAWQSHENFNLVNLLSSYMIGGVPMISNGFLDQGITSAPFVTTVGILDHLTVTNIVITTSTISTTSTGFTATLYLSPFGSGTVDVTGKRITSLSTATERSDAVTKGYVDDLFAGRFQRFAITVDITGVVNVNDRITTILNQTYPIVDPIDARYNLPIGTKCRVLCSMLSSNVPGQLAVVTENFVTVDKGGVQNAQSVLEDISNVTVNQTTATVTTSYEVREFEVNSLLQWVSTGYTWVE
jgi:hypothetical protein